MVINNKLNIVKYLSIFVPFLILVISCNSKVNQKNNDFEIIFKKSIYFPDDYTMDIIFKGPFDHAFDTSMLNFHNKDGKVEYSDLNELISNLENKDQFVLECSTGLYRLFSEMPINVSFTNNFLFQYNDTIYKLKLKNGENKILHIDKIFSKEHFYFNNSKVCNKFRLFYIYFSKGERHIISTQWITQPRSAKSK